VNGQVEDISEVENGAGDKERKVDREDKAETPFTVAPRGCSRT
jgi:hypothetical protein